MSVKGAGRVLNSTETWQGSTECSGLAKNASGSCRWA